jgi:hypothetical protein
MSMQDFASALGGGGAPPGAAPPGLGAPPPDVGTPPPGPAPTDQQGGGGQFATSLDALDAAEEALKAFIDLDPDHADKAVAAQCLQNVLKLKASNQDSAQSGDLSGLARALQQGPPGAAGAPPGAGGPPPGMGY